MASTGSAFDLAQAQSIALELGLNQLALALSADDMQQLAQASETLRLALTTPLTLDQRELGRYARALAHCAELLGRSASKNQRALTAFFGASQGGVYDASGALRI